MGELKTFHCSSTLVGNVANYVRNSFGFIAKVPIRNVGHADVAKSFASVASMRVEEVALHLGSNMLAVKVFKHAVHATRKTIGAARFLATIGISAGCETARDFRVLAASDRIVILVVGSISEGAAHVSSNLRCLVECTNDVLHMVCLATDEALEMDDDSLCLITLAPDGLSRLLQG